MRKLILLGLLMLAGACTDTGTSDESENNAAAGPSETSEETTVDTSADVDEEDTDQATAEGLGDPTAPVTTRLTVKLTPEGEMEVISAMELEGARHKNSIVNEFVYDAVVDGKVVAAGSFANPFTRRSANNPEDGYDHEITPAEQAIVTIDLPGIQADHPGFDLSVERLTTNPHMRTMNFENIASLKDKGGAIYFGRMKREAIAQSLQKLNIQRLNRDRLNAVQSAQ